MLKKHAHSTKKFKRVSLKQFKQMVTHAVMALTLSLTSGTAFAVQEELLDELGFTKLHDKGYTGKDVPIVLTDMQVLTSHKAFQGQVEELYNASEELKPTSEASKAMKEMYYFQGGERVHGTHTASIIKAQENLGEKDKGAAFEARLKTIGLPLQLAIEDSEDRAIWDKVLTVLEAEKEIRLISMSHKLPDLNEEQIERFQKLLVERDCGIIVAAGNSSRTLFEEASFVHFPDETVPNAIDIENANLMNKFNSLPKIKERLLIVGNGSKQKMGDLEFENLFRQLSINSFLKKEAKENIISSMEELLSENNLTFQDLIKLEDDTCEEAMKEVLAVLPDEIPQEEYNRERKRKLEGLTLEELRLKNPTTEEKKLADYYNKSEEKREEFLKQIKDTYQKDLLQRRIKLFKENYNSIVGKKINELTETNAKTKEITDNLFEERRTPEKIALALFSVAKTQLYSFQSSTERGLRLDSGFYGKMTGSNRAGMVADRFITTLGTDVQGASFEIIKDTLTGESKFIDTYRKFTGTSQATPLVTSALALILQKHPTISIPDAMNLLLDTAQPTDYPYIFGRGLMDLPKAMGESEEV